MAELENPNDSGWVSEDKDLFIDISRIVWARWLDSHGHAIIRYRDGDPDGERTVVTKEEFDDLVKKLLHYHTKR